MTKGNAHAPEMQPADIISLKGRRVLLLVPAVTYRATDFILAANRLELDLVIGSDGALPLGGNPVVRVDAADLSGSVSRIRSTVGAVDAVVAVDTQMLLLAATLAAKLGLPHNLRSTQSRRPPTKRSNDVSGPKLGCRSRDSMSFLPRPTSVASSRPRKHWASPA